MYMPRLLAKMAAGDVGGDLEQGDVTALARADVEGVAPLGKRVFG